MCGVQSTPAESSKPIRRLDKGRDDEALRLLEAAPQEHRGWEWRHLEPERTACSRASSPTAQRSGPDGRLVLTGPDERDRLWGARSRPGRPRCRPEFSL